MKPVFALIDCNNFFVSCERVFRPELEGKPVVVLSSNDGCAVARSNEVKQLGMPMGAPYFKHRELFERHNITRFSANFELYANIARRMTNLLTLITPRLEVYSIDESFLDISTLDIKDYQLWGQQLKARIQREIGIPVSIGIAPSKTLAKLGSELAKKQPQHRGAIYLTPDNLQQHLEPFPIEDIWGVGWRLAPKLRSYGISSAWQLAQARPQLLQQVMGIQGRQIASELQGISCHPLAPFHKPQQTIMRGRTFGEDTSDPYVIEAAIATMTTAAAFRLRHESQRAHSASIVVETSRFKPGYQRWQAKVDFTAATHDTGQLITQLTQKFNELHRSGRLYHRINIYLYDLVADDTVQTDILGVVDLPTLQRAENRMQALDSINNRFGRRHLYYAAEDLSSRWQPIKGHQSPHYLTRWADIPVARQLPPLSK